MLAWPSEFAGSSAPLGGAEGFAPTADRVAAIVESQRLAAYTGRVAGSADALLALIRVGGAASRLLQQRGITPGRLEAYMGHVRPEAGQALKQLEASSY